MTHVECILYENSTIDMLRYTQVYHSITMKFTLILLLVAFPDFKRNYLKFVVYWLIGEVVPYTGFAQFDLAAQHSVESYRGHTRRFLGQRQREIHFHGSIKNERLNILKCLTNFFCFDKHTMCNICLHSMCF